MKLNEFLLNEATTLHRYHNARKNGATGAANRPSHDELSLGEHVSFLYLFPNFFR